MDTISNAVLIASLTIAVGLSGWIYISGLGVKGLPGCGKGSGCDAVAKDRWSLWGPIRVSVVGTILYCLMLGLTLFCSFRPKSLWFQTSENALAVLAIMAIGAAVWFVGLQLLVIRRLCFYCMLIHVCGVLASVLLLKDGLRAGGSTMFLKLMLAAIGLTLLIGGQILLKPRSYAVVGSQPLTDSSAGLVAGEEPMLVPPSLRPLFQREVRLRSGRVVLNLDDFPLIGAPTATHVVAYLFDYTCEGCHHLHRLLLEAVTHYGGQLAVVTIPVPMHPSCNPTVKCTALERAFSCAYARLSWAMWTIDIALHAEWVRFMVEESQVKPFGLALLKAQELADISRFKIRDEDDELDLRIASGVRIFRAGDEPKLPALLLRAGVMLGHIPDLNTLIGLLDKHLQF